jgi:hypothetical protein
METLVLNGVPYVKASKAARDLGYTSDYVGQLCRSGHIDAHLVGRTWYVNPEQLGTHRVEKKRMSRVKAREQARKSIEEHAKKIVPKTTNTYTNIAIHYESDTKELIPQVRKITPQSEKPAAFLTHTRPEESDAEEKGYEVINPGKKIVMSGKLTVKDASEDAPDVETVVMQPRIMRKVARRQPVEEKAEEVMRLIEEESVEAPSFMERLSLKDVAIPADEATAEDVSLDSEQSEAVTDLKPTTSTSSIFPYVFGTLLILALGIASIFVEASLIYEHADSAGAASVTATYVSDTDDVLDFLNTLY